MIHKPFTSSMEPPWPVSMAGARLNVLLGWSLGATLGVLPFEMTEGLWLPGLRITNVEMFMLWTLSLWLVLLLVERRLPRVPRALVLPATGFLLVLLLSAVLAQEQRIEALKVVLRQVQGGLLAFCLAERVRSEGWPLTRRLLAALGLGATISAMLGFWELTESRTAIAALTIFKTQLSLMGGELRLSGSFGYTNIAAMYYEAVLPLALAGSLGLIGGRWRWLGVVGAIVLLVATLLTYSRAALFTSGAVLVLVPLVVAWRQPRSAAIRQSLTLSGVLLACGIILVLGTPAYRLRLFEPDVATWYRAVYRASRVEQMAPLEQRSVGVVVTNTGRAAWSHRGLSPVRLAYHWLDATTGEVVVVEGQRSELPHSIKPGESVEILAMVHAPAMAGRYLLAWDLVREDTGGGWFSQMGTPMTDVPVVVAEPAGIAPVHLSERINDLDVPVVARAAEVPVGAARAKASGVTVAASHEPQPPLPFAPTKASPSRRQLWTAALQLWSERPWLGIGPDVFRHIYGPRLGLTTWDTRIHTNSLYLEVLTGSGVFGLVMLLVLIGAVLRMGAQGLWAGDTAWWCMLACLLGFVSFLLHGLLDVFLAYTPTYALFWSLIGMIAGLTAPAATVVKRGAAYANRL